MQYFIAYGPIGDDQGCLNRYFEESHLKYGCIYNRAFC